MVGIPVAQHIVKWRLPFITITITNTTTISTTPTSTTPTITTTTISSTSTAVNYLLIRD